MDALKKAIAELHKEQAKLLERAQRIRNKTEPRKRRRKRKSVKEVSPSLRRKNWGMVTIRAEHHVMLRELSDHHKISNGATAGMLIEKEYFKILREIDPEKAEFIEQRFLSEKVVNKRKTHDDQNDSAS
jgi:hypothetical protein